MAASVVPSVAGSSLIQGKKPRYCENSICPKAYIETGLEPKNFWTRRLLHGKNYSWLCDVCSLAFKNKQYCDYCKQIYFDESEY